MNWKRLFRPSPPPLPAPIGCPHCHSTETGPASKVLYDWRITPTGVDRRAAGRVVVCADCGSAFCVSRRGAWIPKTVQHREKQTDDQKPTTRQIHDIDLRPQPRR